VAPSFLPSADLDDGQTARPVKDLDRKMLRLCGPILRKAIAIERLTSSAGRAVTDLHEEAADWTCLARSRVVTAVPSAFAPDLWLVGPAKKPGEVRVRDVEVHISRLMVVRLLFVVGYSIRRFAWREESVILGEADDLVSALAGIGAAGRRHHLRGSAGTAGSDGGLASPPREARVRRLLRNPRIPAASECSPFPAPQQHGLCDTWSPTLRAHSRDGRAA
jgi:hypothetical protein